MGGFTLYAAERTIYYYCDGARVACCRAQKSCEGKDLWSYYGSEKTTPQERFERRMLLVDDYFEIQAMHYWVRI